MAWFFHRSTLFTREYGADQNYLMSAVLGLPAEIADRTVTIDYVVTALEGENVVSTVSGPGLHKSRVFPEVW